MYTVIGLYFRNIIDIFLHKYPWLTEEYQRVDVKWHNAEILQACKAVNYVDWLETDSFVVVK